MKKLSSNSNESLNPQILQTQQNIVNQPENSQLQLLNQNYNYKDIKKIIELNLSLIKRPQSLHEIFAQFNSIFLFYLTPKSLAIHKKQITQLYGFPYFQVQNSEQNKFYNCQQINKIQKLLQYQASFIIITDLDKFQDLLQIANNQKITEVYVFNNLFKSISIPEMNKLDNKISRKLKKCKKASCHGNLQNIFKRKCNKVYPIILKKLRQAITDSNISKYFRTLFSHDVYKNYQASKNIYKIYGALTLQNHNQKLQINEIKQYYTKFKQASKQYLRYNLLNKYFPTYLGYFQQQTYKLNFNDLKDARKAIQWYADDSFYYKFLNNAMRANQHLSKYASCFYPIYELFTSIQTVNLYQTCIKQKGKRFKKIPNRQAKEFNLYRGCILSQQEFQNYRNKINSFIQVFGFMSCSKNKKTAQEFIQQIPKSKACIIKVVIRQMQIQEQFWKYDGGFCDLDVLKWGRFSQSEVLFNPLNFFKIIDIKDKVDDHQYRQIILQYGSFITLLRKYRNIKTQKDLILARRQCTPSQFNGICNIQHTKIEGEKILTIGDAHLYMNNYEQSLSYLQAHKPDKKSDYFEKRANICQKYGNKRAERQMRSKQFQQRKKQLKDKNDKKIIQLQAQLLIDNLQKRQEQKNDLLSPSLEDKIKSSIQSLKDSNTIQKAKLQLYLGKSERITKNLQQSYKTLQQSLQSAEEFMKKLLNKKKQSKSLRQWIKNKLCCCCCPYDSQQEKRQQLKQIIKFEKQVDEILDFVSKYDDQIENVHKSSYDFNKSEQLYHKCYDKLVIELEVCCNNHQRQKIKLIQAKGLKYQRQFQKVQTVLSQLKLSAQKDSQQKNFYKQYEKNQLIAKNEIIIMSQYTAKGNTSKVRYSISSDFSQQFREDNQNDVLKRVIRLRQIHQLINEEDQSLEKIRRIQVQILNLVKWPQNLNEINRDQKNQSSLELIKKIILKLEQQIQNQTVSIANLFLYKGTLNIQRGDIKQAQKQLKKAQQIFQKLSQIASIPSDVNFGNQIFKLPILKSSIYRSKKEYSKAYNCLNEAQNRMAKKGFLLVQYPFAFIKKQKALVRFDQKKYIMRRSSSLTFKEEATLQQKYIQQFNKALDIFQKSQSISLILTQCRLHYAFCLISDISSIKLPKRIPKESKEQQLYIFLQNKIQKAYELICYQIIRAGQYFMKYNTIDEQPNIWLWYFSLSSLMIDMKDTRKKQLFMPILNKAIQIKYEKRRKSIFQQHNSPNNSGQSQIIPQIIMENEKQIIQKIQKILQNQNFVENIIKVIKKVENELIQDGVAYHLIKLVCLKRLHQHYLQQQQVNQSQQKKIQFENTKKSMQDYGRNKGDDHIMNYELKTTVKQLQNDIKRSQQYSRSLSTN